jgi:hypothetical protein
MVMKAIQYTGDVNRQGSGSRFILVCEVALGSTKEVSDVKYSEHGLGKQGPDDSPINFVTLPDGAKVNLGKVKKFEKRQNARFEYNEFMVPNAD